MLTLLRWEFVEKRLNKYAYTLYLFSFLSFIYLRSSPDDLPDLSQQKFTAVKLKYLVN